MKSRTKKTEELKLLKGKLPKFDIVIFTSFSKAGEKGLSVAQMTELKRSLRSLGSEYFVTKKTLINLALRDQKYEADAPPAPTKSVGEASEVGSPTSSERRGGLDVYGMDGSVGLVLGGSDSYGVAKSVYNFSKKNPALHFWGAIVDGKFIDTDAFLEMAKMPSREVLLGRLVGMLTYPIRGLAVALSEVAKGKETTSQI